MPDGPHTGARNAVAVVFALNGLSFSCLVARLPDIRSGLDLSNGGLGLLLLLITVGSLVALSASGRLVGRFGATAVVRAGCVAVVVGFVLSAAGVALSSSVPVTAAGFLVYGLGIGGWDVAMNVEAAEVERALGRTIMPRFHAGWSLGTFGGAGVGVVLTRLDVPVAPHLVVGALVSGGVAARAAGRFLATSAAAAAPAGPGPEEGRRTRSPWTEPRTLAIGVMVMCFALVEGAANDWLTLALIDGYDVPHWAGVAGFALFVSAMTTGRLTGPAALDRFGRAPVLGLSALVSAVGVLLVVWGGSWPLVALGILLWGTGAALGFPVGMSAAADDPVGAARRVGVVATIAYGAFLGGPPLLGALADRVGTLESLLAAAGVMVVAMLTVGAARERSATTASD
ncbi:MFS transporter [Nocardioides sp. TF02-7]|uniref:MFS transporter n=1 Tax=Nocardioides sp. TF02-7 TaxID=2917724 RepID=UPI001F054324|nr:MFS transporter [Nocardioides sp. TF02-7]UMG91986.1 MFS transporter [Nocardioides sp. TF02-7]